MRERATGFSVSRLSARQQLQVEFSVCCDTWREGPLLLLLSFLLEILDSALSSSIACPALLLAWEKFGDCSGQLPLPLTLSQTLSRQKNSLARKRHLLPFARVRRISGSAAQRRWRRLLRWWRHNAASCRPSCRYRSQNTAPLSRPLLIMLKVHCSHRAKLLP